MKSYFLVVLIFLFLVSAPTQVFAQSSYVLPYPSFMPGSIFYKVNLIKEEISKYWYFGNFGQFKYNLKQSDKYLIEAKTLFEYKQYLLAVNALEKSDFHFSKTKPSLLNAEREGKNISQNLLTLESAKEKHIEILEKISKEVPENFLWQPEKKKPTTLYLRKEIREAIDIKKKNL